MTHIASRQNPLVAACRALAEHPEPDGQRLLLDGEHLVSEAHAAGLRFEHVAVRESSLGSHAPLQRLVNALGAAGVEILTTSDAAMAAMSPVRTPSGIVAITHRGPSSLTEVLGRPDAFVVAIADVQDPGNLGAILRVAEAGGATGAVVCGASANPFGWKAVRGSMGSVLRLPVVYGGAPRDVLTAMTSAGLRSVACVARGGCLPSHVDWGGGVALWLGGEGPGLDEALAAACDARVAIPMAPPVESLNVAVAAGILIYAARRVAP